MDDRIQLVLITIRNTCNRLTFPVFARCDCPSSQLEHIDCQRQAYPLVAQHTTLLIDDWTEGGEEGGRSLTTISSQLHYRPGGITPKEIKLFRRWFRKLSIMIRIKIVLRESLVIPRVNKKLPQHGRLARWRKWRDCDVGEAKEGLGNELWRRWSNRRVIEWAGTWVKRRKGWRMSCDVGEVKERLENEHTWYL